MIAGICIFPRLPCPSTKRHVMLNLTSAAAAAAASATALRTAGWSCSVFFFLLPTLLRKLHGDGCCCTEPSETFRVRPRYDYEKKHVSRDSKMCCCCCRFCCGAPTTDERIHAPVLSMMHRRLTTAGIEVAPHYHQLLVVSSTRYIYRSQRYVRRTSHRIRVCHKGYTYAFIYSYHTYSAGDCTYVHTLYFRTYIVRGTSELIPA